VLSCGMMTGASPPLRNLILVFSLALTPMLANAENRLADAASPYLRQHADNPVDWYPWGEEALARAREEGKPIYVSVGYSACHWCHVMEEESFSDQEVADLLNAHFIAIKIDREERPDLDEKFILVTSMLNGSAGWPNGVFLTPEGDPFFGSGYMPKAEFLDLLAGIAGLWREDPEGLRARGFSISMKLREYLAPPADAKELSQPEILDLARALLEDLDPFNGGFGTAPKFPREPVLLLLLDQAERSGDPELLEAAQASLDGMIRGGIHDHVSGGFHRYATDPEWHIPHFEKMLYNQALIARALLRSYALSGSAAHARAARRTLDFALREMQAPGGGFYAALDADSSLPDGRKEEGAFYTWTPEEIRAALPPDMAESAISLFNMGENGPLAGRSVLRLPALPEEAAGEAGLSLEQYDSMLEMLRAARETRPRPFRDEKIVLAWNGEMIATLAEAGWLLDRPDYTEAAAKAARFILARMWPESGLRRIWIEGAASTEAQLADYAAFGNALIALHAFAPADQGNDEWLPHAERLADEMIRRFADDPDRPLSQPLRMRHKPSALGPFRPIDDTEIPSGNALALSFLAALDRLSGKAPPRAQPLALALGGAASRDPMERAGLLKAIAAVNGGETGPVRFSPGGAVRVMAAPGKPLGLDIRPGWHVNAHRPLDSDLIATTVSIDGKPLAADVYPRPLLRRLGFSPDPLALYEGRLSIPLPDGKSMEADPGQSHEIAVTIQACNDRICLPPEDIIFRRWGAALSPR